MAPYELFILKNQNKWTDNRLAKWLFQIQYLSLGGLLCFIFKLVDFNLIWFL